MDYKGATIRGRIYSDVSGFFFTLAKKLKAKKTPATKKLKHFFSQKLKVPEDFSKFMLKKLNLSVVFYKNVDSKWHS